MLLKSYFYLTIILLLSEPLVFGDTIDEEYTEDEKNEIELYRQLFRRLNLIIKSNINVEGDIRELKEALETFNKKFDNQTSTRIPTPTTIPICCNNTPHKNKDPYVDDKFTCFGDGWIIIQRRYNGAENFDRSWQDYKKGFGNNAHEFFIGLEKLYALTLIKPHELLIVLKDFDNQVRYAHYDNFRLAPESESYRIEELGRYSGTAGDSLSYHKGAKFSTQDRDNDAHADLHCAKKFGGGWWYQACHESNLNGHYIKSDHNLSYASGIHWKTFRPNWYSLKFSQMMVRPK
ncbi:microfibril-associated glycoprotein 4-like [Musca autumnalis]|uniref:microfibril-associated glycoprotein 4-like n=1 Tax=Musca autumnalis TaxID=221902 RepID=UPI003CEA2669